MKRHLHLAISVSAFVLAACCVAGAGLAWLRAAAGAVARAAMLCTVSEPLTAAPEAVPAALPGDTVVLPQTAGQILWFGATQGLCPARDADVTSHSAAAAVLRRSDCAGPPGDARAGCPALTVCPALAACAV